MSVSLAQIPGAFHLPRPNWKVIHAWVQKQLAESDQPEAWAEIAVQWLDELNRALGGRYRIEHGDRLLLFAPQDYEHGENLLGFAESTIEVVTDVFETAAGRDWCGPLVILLFANAESYALYVSPHEADHESLRSGGVCFPQGYVHIALRPYPLETLQRVLVHEVVHACLSHLKLPLWLEEGVTQMAEEAMVPNWSSFTLDGKQANELRQFWKTHGLSDFWWYHGFRSLDEGQAHCYALAQILFRLIVADHRKRLVDFVRNARVEDAGDSAARAFLGKGVGDLAAQFLGPGAWEPVPPDAPLFVRRGALYLSRKDYPRALADFSDAVRLDPKNAAAHRSRGTVHYLLQHHDSAIRDYEEAIRLDPYEVDAHNNLAWLLATCPQDQYRDGERAVELASKAHEMTGGTAPWYFLGTMAAAFAEIGDFEEARRWAKESGRLAPEEERPGCKERLVLYRSGQPYREEQPSLVAAEGAYGWRQEQASSSRCF